MIQRSQMRKGMKMDVGGGAMIKVIDATGTIKTRMRFRRDSGVEKGRLLLRKDRDMFGKNPSATKV